MTTLAKQLRFFNQIQKPATSSSFFSPLTSLRRHITVPPYVKNVEEEPVPTIVPEDVIKSKSDKYWAPDPETGVFGPDTEIDPATFHAPSNDNGTDQESVLEQQAFIRPHEDLEIPVEELEEPIEP